MRSIFIVALLATLYGCSNREIYDSQQGAKQHSCAQIVADDERSQCFEAANKSYERYEQERDELISE